MPSRYVRAVDGVSTHAVGTRLPTPDVVTLDLWANFLGVTRARLIRAIILASLSSVRWSDALDSFGAASADDDLVRSYLDKP